MRGAVLPVAVAVAATVFCLASCGDDKCKDRPAEAQIDVRLAGFTGPSPVATRVKIRINGGQELTRRFPGAEPSFVFEFGASEEPRTLAIAIEALDANENVVGSGSWQGTLTNDGCNFISVENRPEIPRDAAVDLVPQDAGLDAAPDGSEDIAVSDGPADLGAPDGDVDGPDSGLDLAHDVGQDIGQDLALDGPVDAAIDLAADLLADSPQPDLIVDSAPVDSCVQNGCGGCAVLDPPLGSECGVCGEIVCGGSPNETECADAPPTGNFSAVTLVANVNTTESDSEPDISADGLSLYFRRSAGIYVATRTSTENAFGTPTVAIAKSDHSSPSISPDGLTLYMVQTNGVDYTLRAATRGSTAVAFGQPFNIGGLNTGDRNTSPEIGPDDATLYFDSNESGGLGGQDIMVASRVPSSFNFTDRSRLVDLSSSESDSGPTVTADHLTIIFSRSVSGNENLFISTRTSDTSAWPTPTALPGSVNSGSAEVAPSISADGKTLYFQSNRGGGIGGWDIWQSTRNCQ